MATSSSSSIDATVASSPASESTRILRKEKNENPERAANPLSLLTFWWCNSLVWLAIKRRLEAVDVWPVHPRDESEVIYSKFEAHWKRELEKPNPSVSKALFRAFAPYYLAGSLMYGIFAGSQLAGPELLRRIVIWFTNNLYHIPQDPYVGYYYCIALFLVAMVGSICFYQSMYMSARTGAHLKAVVVLAVYRKATLLSLAARAGASQGQIVNLMSNDSQRLQETFEIINFGLWAPIQIIVALGLLWQVIGIYTLVGLGVMVITFPFNGIIDRALVSLRRTMITFTDHRVKIINEIFQAIKIIKLYAWEDSFIARVGQVRGQELQALKGFNVERAKLFGMLNITPTVVTVLVFVSYQQSGHALTADRVFAAVGYLNVIRMPLAFLPFLLAFAAQLEVTFQRLQPFLLEKEVPQSTHRRLEHGEAPSIAIHDGDFSWGMIDPKAQFKDQQVERMKQKQAKQARKKELSKMSKEERHKQQAEDKEAKQKSKGKEATRAEAEGPPEIVVETAAPICLHSIDFEATGSHLVMVVGPVGSGKTSFCMALLGELERKRGTGLIKGSIAYSAQKEWIINASLRDNILFGMPFDEERYQRIIDVCALRKDLELFPAGDLVEIGERGINLSGGQKQRVSLARAVYSNADIMIFDDPLNAVDASVGKHLFFECIMKELRGKLVVLTTNQLQYLPYATQVIVLKDGSIAERGTYSELMSHGLDFASLMTNFGLSEETVANEFNDNINGDKDEKSIEVMGAEDSKKSATPSPGKLIEEEERAEGEVSFKSYGIYLKSGGVVTVIFFLTFFVLEIASRLGTDYWLSYWTSHGFVPGARSSGFYLGIYIGFGAFSGIMTAIRSGIFVTFSYNVSYNFHSNLLRGVLRAPMSFFDTTPVGRIINRFARDVDGIDNLLPQAFMQLLGFGFNTLAIIVLVSAIIPYLLIVFAPLLVVYYFLQKYYRYTSRELQRMEALSRSPIFAHFSETLAGTSSIRAYGAVDRFIGENSLRMEENTRLFLALQATNQWMGVRLDIMGNLIVFATAILLIGTSFEKNPALVGLALSYVLSLTGLLNRASLAFSDTETKMNSIERIADYTDTPSEAAVITNVRPPASWPDQGEIAIKDLVMRYRAGLDPVLKGVTCHLRPHEKVGIVGRTGAGKSSILLALFRLVEKDSGSIVVDGIDVGTLGLNDLRKNISIIPQESILFSGDIRINLDPFHQHSDQEVWDALEQVQLKAVAEGLGGLTAKVSEGGENWSVGQRQLICLGRALLRKPRILVLDEATASVDVVTDNLIQKTLREKFADATILTIAHRLNTIMDSDRIVVMSDGRVEEIDTPANLLRDPNGFLTHLVDETGPSNAAFLRAIAQGTASVLDALHISSTISPSS